MSTLISAAGSSALEIARPDPSLTLSADYAVYTEGLVRNFDGLRAVDEVDIRIPAGEIYGFLGPNGAGKSTTVRMLCTLLAPTAGRALVAGYDVVSRSRTRRLTPSKLGASCCASRVGCTACQTGCWPGGWPSWVS
jgi:ABC-type protease/lipase transport system fused ATPase/permease subunit